MIASGERDHGSQLHLYQSRNLLDWTPVGTILDVKAGSNISPHSRLKFGMNFECASFFSIGMNQYLTLGVEEDHDSPRHSKRYTLWLSGHLVLDNGKPRFVVKSHGLLDHGISYAPHIFRDAESRLLQLGWADEAAKSHVVAKQGWAGCLAFPRELYEISRPVTKLSNDSDLWDVDESSGHMTTLGIRPAPQVTNLRKDINPSYLHNFSSIRSKNYSFEATFSDLAGKEKFSFNIRQSSGSAELTRIIFNIENSTVTVDRSRSSLENLGTTTADLGSLHILPDEDLHVQIFVDNSLIEIYANDRLALTSRVYPSLESSLGASYDFGGFDPRKIKFECWEGLKNAWPGREEDEHSPQEAHPCVDLKDEKLRIDSTVSAMPAVISA